MTTRVVLIRRKGTRASRPILNAHSLYWTGRFNVRQPYENQGDHYFSDATGRQAHRPNNYPQGFSLHYFGTCFYVVFLFSLFTMGRASKRDRRTMVLYQQSLVSILFMDHHPRNHLNPQLAPET
jgi:hypothetical protein